MVHSAFARPLPCCARTVPKAPSTRIIDRIHICSVGRTRQAARSHPNPTPARSQTMRPHALALVLALLVAPAALAAADFQRPANGDCITITGSQEVSLYPEQYMMVGDARDRDGFVTQARGGGLRAAAAAAASPRQVAAGN